LVAVRLTRAPGIDPVPATELDRVVGAYATMRLARGSLLTPAQITTDPVPGPGQHVVGITLGGDRLPAQHPRPGDPVLLVATPDRSATAVDAGPPRTWRATVTAVAGDGSPGFLGGGGRDV